MKDKGREKLGWLAIPLLFFWAFIAAVNLFALFWENIISALLFTTGGWANGWPLGISYPVALSIGGSLCVAAMLLTAATAAGAALGFCFALFQVSWRRQVAIGLWCFSIAAAVILCLSCLSFIYFYARADSTPLDIEDEPKATSRSDL